MKEIWLEEKDAVNNNGKVTLIRAFVRASEADNARDQRSYIEIMGNCFMYTIAGHDTIANNLSDAISLLSILPLWQDLIREEINAVFGKAEDE